MQLQPQIPTTVQYAALITGTATLLAAGVAWLKDRNAAARRIQILDEATKYVAFWTAVKNAEEANSLFGNNVMRDLALDARVKLAAKLVTYRGTFHASRWEDLLLNVSQRVLQAGLSILAFLAFFILGITMFPFPKAAAVFLVIAFTGVATCVLGLVVGILESSRVSKLEEWQTRSLPAWPSLPPTKEQVKATDEMMAFYHDAMASKVEQKNEPPSQPEA